MNDLEIILQRIETIRPDLYAEIVIREEEKEHFERVWRCPHEDHGFRYYDMFDDPYEVNGDWVSGKDRIAHPDTQKREQAKTQLESIYNSLKWYSTRYAAGQALGIEKEELDKEIDSWMEDGSLEKRLNAVRVFEEQTETGKTSMNVVDVTKRKETLNDLICLYQLSNSQKAREVIKRVYNRQIGTAKEEEIMRYGSFERMDFNDHMIITAGKALGYSSPGIWYHKDKEHALTTLFVLAVSVGSLGIVAAYVANKISQ